LKGGIQSKFGALFGPKKSISAGENLRSDSPLFRISPVPLIRKAEEMNLVAAQDLYDWFFWMGFGIGGRVIGRDAR
jgi:hypothetical protein